MIVNKTLDRRTLLKGAGALALMGGVGFSARAREAGGLLWQPGEASSVGNVLDTVVNAQYGSFDLAGQKVSLRGYDGGPVGRTLRLRAGDTLRLRLKNEFPWEPSGAICGGNVPHALNTTNMHLHGVHVSPNQPSDYILLALAPKTPLSPVPTQEAMSDYQYVYKIGADHPPGTYFYHAHYHGSVALQVSSGMAGCLIIEGEMDRIPEIAAAAERVLMVQSQCVGPDGTCESYEQLELVPGAPPRPTYVNGQLVPKIAMRPGEVQRWRVINGTHDRLLWLGLDGLKTMLLCCDGNPLPKAEEVTGPLRFVPGNRLDLLVKAPSQPGTYAIASGDGTGPLVTVVVDGQPKPMALFSGALPSSPLLRPISAAEIQYGRRLTFGMTGAPAHTTYTINGVPFSCETPWEIPLGRVEEWEITNQTNDSHPFHIHVNPFQMVSGGNVPAGRWLDTVEVPPTGKVTFRTRFDQFTGLFVFHCHTLVHEDMGMMQAIKVV
ncbi:MAG: multicopper oxidase family protein [Rhodospirillaceae bacterium]|nr:multicopper oxidase family protein [Rhodospirillales bacterium]